jgi:hypothetical protein
LTGFRDLAGGFREAANEEWQQKGSGGGRHNGSAKSEKRERRKERRKETDAEKGGIKGQAGLSVWGALAALTGQARIRTIWSKKRQGPSWPKSLEARKPRMGC